MHRFGKCLGSFRASELTWKIISSCLIQKISYKNHRPLVHGRFSYLLKVKMSKNSTNAILRKYRKKCELINVFSPSLFLMHEVTDLVDVLCHTRPTRRRGPHMCACKGSDVDP
jgi:hypothetical protein